MEYVPAKRFSLKASAVYNEKWLQNLIVEDPTILGLGDLVVKDVERRQPRAGRLDLLLADPIAGTRYEVEIQLGQTDESHIIRTIEYWDIERSRYPNIEHVAVIVAEDITSRFLNVISLFNKAIPVIAIQINALDVGGQLTLDATTVLDLVTIGTEDEDEPGQAVDRGYWLGRVAPEAIATMDSLQGLIQETTGDVSIALKYNKRYVGLARNGLADNFINFHPRKNGKVLTGFRVTQTTELINQLEDDAST